MTSPTYAAIFGRNPALTVSELTALSETHGFAIRPLGKYAVELDGFDPALADRTGAVTKLVRLSARTYPDATAALQAEAAAISADAKFPFGVSSYADDRATPLATVLKRHLKERDIPARFIGQPKGRSGRWPDGELSAVQVRHGDLLTRGADFCIFGTPDGYRSGRTAWVYDFEGFAARDYDKPAADARRGMLPPQLARTMVNLATCGDPDLAVYDPFCGNGNLLIESAMLGHRTLGSDITEDAVGAARQNLRWLAERHPELPKAEVTLHDATMSLDADAPAVLATEGYLGDPLGQQATAADMEHQAKFVETLIGKFLQRAADFLEPGRRVVITFPAWRTPGSRQPHRLLDVERISRLGYTVIRPVPEGFSFPELTSRGSIDVARPKQRVVHELFIFQKH